MNWASHYHLLGGRPQSPRQPAGRATHPPDRCTGKVGRAWAVRQAQRTNDGHTGLPAIRGSRQWAGSVYPMSPPAQQHFPNASRRAQALGSHQAIGPRQQGSLIKAPRSSTLHRFSHVASSEAPAVHTALAQQDPWPRDEPRSDQTKPDQAGRRRMCTDAPYHQKSYFGPRSGQCTTATEQQTGITPARQYHRLREGIGPLRARRPSLQCHWP